MILFTRSYEVNYLRFSFSWSRAKPLRRRKADKGLVLHSGFFLISKSFRRRV